MPGERFVINRLSTTQAWDSGGLGLKFESQSGADISSKISYTSNCVFGGRDSNYTWFTLRTQKKPRLCIEFVWVNN